jgi:hypothetical protein
MIKKLSAINETRINITEIKEPSKGTLPKSAASILHSHKLYFECLLQHSPLNYAWKSHVMSAVTVFRIEYVSILIGLYNPSASFPLIW